MKNRGRGIELDDALNLAVPLREPPPGLEEKILAALPARQKASPKIPLVWGVAAAAVILLLATANLVLWLTPRPSLAALKPGLMVVMLNGTSAAPKAFGTIVLDPDDNHGILAVRDLPRLAKGQYQLWLKKESEIHSAGVFAVDADGYGSLLLTIPQDFRGFREFLLSEEPQGGSAAPSFPEVMTGHF